MSSVLLYPKTLGGGAVFSGWLPFNTSIIERISSNAKRVLLLKNTMISSFSLQTSFLLLDHKSGFPVFFFFSLYFLDLPFYEYEIKMLINICRWTVNHCDGGDIHVVHYSLQPPFFQFLFK